MPVVVVEEEALGVRPVLVGQWVELVLAEAIVVRGVATGPLLRTGSDAFFVLFCFFGEMFKMHPSIFGHSFM